MQKWHGLPVTYFQPRTTQRLQSAVASRQATLATVLQAAEQWRQAELALVASVVNYNQAIGDYILSVEPNQPASSLVGLMIGSPSAGQPGGVIPASGNLPVRQAQLPDAAAGQSVLQNRPAGSQSALPATALPAATGGQSPGAFAPLGNQGLGGSFSPTTNGTTNQTAPPAQICAAGAAST